MGSSLSSAKEQALLDAARREVAAKRVQPGAAAPLPAGLATTPLDQPTVLGWDHHAAAPDAAQVKVAPDRWSHVAALMEAERSAEADRRARLRTKALYAALAVAVVALVLVLFAFKR